MVSLGCPKNLVDSERMLGLLRQDGWQLVGAPDGADLVVVNTCAFIDASREESYGVVREMLDLKKAGGTRGVIVAGCLAERQKESLLEELPGLDAVIVNPVYMIGPWDWKPSSGRMLLEVGAGKGLFAPPGSNDFVDVRDMATAFALGAAAFAPVARAEGPAKAVPMSRLHPAGVQVLTIKPGFVDTPMTSTNEFPMPFIISAEDAAKHIVRGFERNRLEIIFPWQMALLMKIARVLPQRLWLRLIGTRRKAAG